MAVEPETTPGDGEWILHEGPGPYTGWLYRHPDGALVAEDGTVLGYADIEAPEPEPAPCGQLVEVGDDEAAETEPEPEADPEPDEPEAGPPATVPTYVRWETSSLPQYAAGFVFLAAAISAVLLVVTSLSSTTDPGRLTTGVALALLAAAALYGVSAFAPSTVVVRDATVTVARGDTEVTFDLADPETQVDLGDTSRSASWRARLRSQPGDVEALRRTQVQPGPFSDVVRHHLVAREPLG